MLNNFWLKSSINQPFTLHLHELIKLIKAKKMNPQNVIKSFLKRIKKKNKHIRAISTIDKKYIYDQFKKIDSNLPLSFMPVGIKDIYQQNFLETLMKKKMMS